MSDAKRFFKNTVTTLSRQIMGIALGLLGSIIIARVLGPKGNGLYSLIILLPTTLMTLLNFGVGTSSVYYIGQKKYQIKDIVKTNTLTGLMLSTISIVVGIIVILFFSEKIFEGVPHIYLYLILLMMPFLMVNDIYLVIFQATQDFRTFNTLALIRQFGALLTLAVLLFIFQTGLVGTVISFAIGVLAQFAFTMYFFKDRMNMTIFSGKHSKDYFKKSLSFGFRAHFSNILSFINYRADMVLLASFLNPAAVGLYGVAVSIAEKLWIVSQAISSVLYPVVASSNDNENKNRLTSAISRNVLFFSILGGIVFYLFSNLIFNLLYGPEFSRSSDMLKLLLPGIVLFSVDRILSNDLAGRGKPELNMYTSMFTVVSNIGLNIILIPRIGIAGSAISTSVTYSLSTFIKMILFKKNTGVPYSKLLIPQKEDLLVYKQILNKVMKRK